MRAKVVGGCLQEGGSFPIYFYIFEKGWGGLNNILTKYIGCITIRGRLQERIR